MKFTDEQKRALSAPLAASHVKEREQGGRRLSYIEGWLAIAEANRIFGFDAWHRETLDIRCVSESPRKIGKTAARDGFGVTYIARVRVTVGDIVREGTGAGHGIDADLGLAHESAIKEAETDAMKRALMTFGNPFGLALYDKDQRNVAPDTAAADAYTSASKAVIATFGTESELRIWWKEQASARAKNGLTQEHVDELLACIKARISELSEEKDMADETV